MTRTTSGISVLLLMVAVINGLWWNIDIISFTDVCHSGPVAYDLRVTHISRRLFGVSGTITLAADFLEYLADAQIMFAPRPGGRFALFPLNIPPRDMCVGLNDFYVRYGMKDLANCSDLPQVDGPGPEVCQLFPNKTFTVDNYLFDPKPIPQMLQVGMYRVELRILNGTRRVSGVQILFQLS